MRLRKWFGGIKERFRRRYTLGLVRDHITIKEGKDTLDLMVSESAIHLVDGIVEVQKKLQATNQDTDTEEARPIVAYFAGVLFGEQQARKLFDFYGDDPAYVLQICEKYFTKRLNRKIVQAQKRSK